MTKPARSVRAAQQVLEEAGVVRLPVRVRELAQKHAFVLRDTLPTDVSAMLIPTSAESTKRWIIVTNNTHGEERVRFSIAHEFGHLLLHEYTAPHADGAQRVRFRDGLSSLGTDREEIEANQFAAELLMPASLLIPKLRAMGLDTWNGDISDSLGEALKELARECKVSEQALLIRIGNLVQST